VKRVYDTFGNEITQLTAFKDLVRFFIFIVLFLCVCQTGQLTLLARRKRTLRSAVKV
jgi:cytochrome c biogenesis factor